jgi:hypothetical protein
MTLERDEFAVGDELVVEANYVWGDETLGAFECAVSCGGRRVASAALKVYRDPKP